MAEPTAKELLQEIKKKKIPLSEQKKFVLEKSQQAREVEKRVEDKPITVRKPTRRTSRPGKTISQDPVEREKAKALDTELEFTAPIQFEVSEEVTGEPRQIPRARRETSKTITVGKLAGIDETRKTPIDDRPVLRGRTARRAEALAEREQKIQEVKESIFTKLGIQEREGERTFLPRKGAVVAVDPFALGRAAARLPGEVVAGTLTLGGRAAFATDVLVTGGPEGRAELSRTIKDVPAGVGAIGKGLDPRKPSGAISLGVIATGLASGISKLQTAKAKPIIAEQAVTQRTATKAQIVDITQTEVQAVLGKQKITGAGVGLQKTVLKEGFSVIRGKTKVAVGPKITESTVRGFGTGTPKTQSIVTVAQTKGQPLSVQFVKTQKLSAQPIESFKFVSVAGKIPKGKGISQFVPEGVSKGVTKELSVISTKGTASFRGKVLGESGKVIQRTQLLETGRVQVPAGEFAVRTGISPQLVGAKIGAEALPRAAKSFTAKVGPSVTGTATTQLTSVAPTATQTVLSQTKAAVTQQVAKLQAQAPLQATTPAAVSGTISFRPQRTVTALKQPKTKELAITQQITTAKRTQVPRQRPISALAQEPLQETAQKPILLKKTVFKTEQRRRAATVQKPISLQAQAQEPIAATRQAFKTAFKPITSAVSAFKIPALTRVPKTPFAFFIRGRKGKEPERGLPSLPSAQKTRFAPTAFAATFNIRGITTPEQVRTGLGIRPIRTKKKKKKGKR